MKRIVIAGGGSGGHVYPSLAVIEALRNLSKEELEIIYIGSNSNLEAPLYEVCDRPYTISAGKVNRHFTPRNFIEPFKTCWGWLRAMMILLREMPDVIFSKGGYVSFPVAFAAWIFRIPVVVHESDAIPGLSNRILGKLSKRIVLGFKQASRYFLSGKTIVVGNIARPAVREGNAQRGREKFGLSESKPVILVLGGSQGSQNINRHIVEILAEILPYSQVLHQTGRGNLEEVKRLASKRGGVKAGRRGYHVIDFLDEEGIQDALAVADLVISRSGATSIAEIAACQKVAILIPLASSANNHQRMNAFVVAEQGGALVLEEPNLTVNVLFEKVKKLLFEQELRQSLSANIAAFYNERAAAETAEIVLSQIKE